MLLNKIIKNIRVCWEWIDVSVTWNVKSVWECHNRRQSLSRISKSCQWNGSKFIGFFLFYGCLLSGREKRAHRFFIFWKPLDPLGLLVLQLSQRSWFGSPTFSTLKKLWSPPLVTVISVAIWFFLKKINSKK